ncbi:Hypothetical protein PHPALM_13991 [Phytophthora palmivora]|uniref:Uncharacterized protein n=1 Tax=Phytophthora palmivora TaxID=4796 RepID=A0A2P4XVW4_9STRA|nr:Hypothetical protein PHPALM_13991 [Phytophthora palmivora]
MEHIKRPEERMDNVKAKIDGTTLDNKSKKRQQEPKQEQDKPKRGRGSHTVLLATIWERFNAKQFVAMMKLFVADDLKLDPGADDYRDRALELEN